MALLRKNNIAIIAPTINAYSETFITAHYKFLEGKIFYYFGGLPPSQLDGKGFINAGLRRRIKYLFNNKTLNTDLTFAEYCLACSIKTNKIDVVLAEYGYSGAEVVRVCKRLGLPLLVHFHGGDAYHFETIKRYRDRYKEMFKYSSSVFAVSMDMKQQLINLGCPQEKIIYNPYGPDYGFFTIKPSYESKTFLSVGRFVDKKAPYFLILAFARIADRYPEAKLYMAGDGYLLQTCNDLVNYYDLTAKIIFVGVLSSKEVMDYMAKSFAFIQHSKVALSGDTEGTPVAIIEAQAAGLPVIATHHAGITDVIVNEETGFLVNENDVEAFVKQMERLLLLPLDEYERISRQAKERIKKLFDLKMHIDKVNRAIGALFHE